MNRDQCASDDRRTKVARAGPELIGHLPAPDLDASRSFYADAFGWQFNDYGPEYAGIHGPEPDDPEAGGLAAQGRDNPVVILYSADLDGTMRAVEAAGGEITDGPCEFPGGRRFHFTDPSGNELPVWSSVSGAD